MTNLYFVNYLTKSIFQLDEDVTLTNDQLDHIKSYDFMKVIDNDNDLIKCDYELHKDVINMSFEDFSNEDEVAFHIKQGDVILIEEDDLDITDICDIILNLSFQQFYDKVTSKK